jgi:hypothetical protein
MTVLVNLITLSNDIHLCLSKISCIALRLALLEDGQKFKLGGCVASNKT